MITNTMTIKLIDFYTESTKKKVKRKKVKIIVDSLIEQLCNYFLKRQPNGIANIRVTINSILDKSEDNDKEVLNKFDRVLRSYDEAFSKGYSDYSDNFNSFLDGDLKELILVLIKYNYIEDTEFKSQLRELLE